METPFTYEYKGCHIDYKGLGFDSLLELRYAISIEQGFAFMREGIKIFYDPSTEKSTNYLRAGIRRYTPDFLIRNWQTGKAFLIEVKPSGFDDFNALSLYQNICNHYIETNKYDWEFKVIFEENIILSPGQQALFDAVLSNKILYRKRYECNSLDLRKQNGLATNIKYSGSRFPPDVFLLYLKRNKLPCNSDR